MFDSTNIAERRALNLINKVDFPADEFSSLEEFSTFLHQVNINIVFKAKKFNNPLEILTKCITDYRKTQLYDYFMEELQDIPTDDTQLCIIFPGVYNVLFAITNLDKSHFYNRTYINLNSEFIIVHFKDMVEVLREMVAG